MSVCMSWGGGLREEVMEEEDVTGIMLLIGVDQAILHRVN